MAKQIIRTDRAPQPLAGYSQAVKSGAFVFVAGQGPFEAATGNVHGESIQEQTGQCLRNVAAIRAPVLLGHSVDDERVHVRER